MDNKEEKITIGSNDKEEVNCSMCGKTGFTDDFITLHNNKKEIVYLCPDCKIKTNDFFEQETKNIKIFPGILMGLLGALIGGIIWYFIAILTSMEIGYISLGLGYLVGMGVFIGSGKKRGKILQIISLVITIITIFITEKFIFDHFLNKYIQENIKDFPQFVGQQVSSTFFNPEFLKSLISPISLLIYAIGVYFAYKVCKPRKI